MRNPKSLPAELQGRVFTRAEAVGLGVTDARLKARDISRVAHSIYVYERIDKFDLVSPEDLVGSSPHRADLLRAICGRTPNVWISHVTAAQVYGLMLPQRFERDERVHLTGVNRSRLGRRDVDIALHRCRELPAELCEVQGVRVSAPERLLLELSSCLNLTEHIVLGDQLVRWPHPGLEPRSEPWARLPALRQAVEEWRGRRGSPQARRALRRVRVGADSPPETLMRLALEDAGLPEPELQIALDPLDRYSPVGDAGYRDARIVIQYDGVHHFSPDQQARDQRRNACFENEGWIVVMVNRVDLAEGFRGMVRRVRSLLSARTPNRCAGTAETPPL